jgi:hypothetical protein
MSGLELAVPMVRTPAGKDVPWYVWCTAAAVTLDMIGFHWDISWHRSIGRDAFWTPPHIAIHLCAVLAGIACASLILRTTFDRSDPRRYYSVGVLGFRGPLGAFIAAWGGVAMLTSAPFDNWWHNAYGLDLKIFSIPHLLLASGMMAIAFGTLILTWEEMNRARGNARQKLGWIFLYISGLLLGAATTPGNALLVHASEDSFTVLMHSAIFYRILAIEVPLVLAGLSRALSGTDDGLRWNRWTTTSVAAAYTAIWLIFEWVLPLFPAQPKLGPIYRDVGHFVPVDFPLLIVIPAFVLDLLWPKIVRYNDWAQAVIAGTAFLTLFVAAQWPFASFLLSPMARNWIFGGNDLSPFLAPDAFTVRHQFLLWEPSRQAFYRGMLIALASAIITTRLGLYWGNWMRALKR